MIRMYPAIAFAVFGILSGCQARKDTAETTNAVVADASHGSMSKITNTSSPSLSCPGKDFATFLQTFAADDQVRDQFTAPEVLVTDWRDVNETQEGTQVTAVAKSAYSGFTLRYRDGVFHDISPDGAIDPNPVKVEVSEQGAEYSVSYQYNLGEGNSWRFKPKDGCWYLAEDPEPSDP
jgi:hypothetical protein